MDIFDLQASEDEVEARNDSTEIILDDQDNRSALQNHNTLKWLRQRVLKEISATKKTTTNYLHTPKELQRIKAIRKIFQIFDDDHSGTLDIQEVMTMFKANGIFMSSDLLKELFKIVDEKGSGQLTLQEFKRFSMLEDASLQFRQIMRGITYAYKGQNIEKNASTHQKNAFSQTQKKVGLQPTESPEYLPLNFNSLVQYFCTCSRRKLKEEQIDEAINKTIFNPNKDCTSFKKLFQLNTFGNDEEEENYFQQLYKNSNIKKKIDLNNLIKKNEMATKRQLGRRNVLRRVSTLKVLRSSRQLSLKDLPKELDIKIKGERSKCTLHCIQIVNKPKGDPNQDDGQEFFEIESEGEEAEYARAMHKAECKIAKLVNNAKEEGTANAEKLIAREMKTNCKVTYPKQTLLSKENVPKYKGLDIKNMHSKSKTLSSIESNPELRQNLIFKPAFNSNYQEFTNNTFSNRGTANTNSIRREVKKFHISNLATPSASSIQHSLDQDQFSNPQPSISLSRPSLRSLHPYYSFTNAMLNQPTFQLASFHKKQAQSLASTSKLYQGISVDNSLCENDLIGNSEKRNIISHTKNAKSGGNGRDSFKRMFKLSSLRVQNAYQEGSPTLRRLDNAREYFSMKSPKPILDKKLLGRKSYVQLKMNEGNRGKGRRDKTFVTKLQTSFYDQDFRKLDRTTNNFNLERDNGKEENIVKALNANISKLRLNPKSRLNSIYSNYQQYGNIF